jgi:hypothetical protein
VLLAVLPLLVVSPSELLGIYEAWYGQVLGDYSAFKGMSLYSLIEVLSGWDPPKQVFIVVSLLLMLAPLVQVQKWKELWFRELVLAAILIWVVIFNHKAESQTYVIAMVGIVLWYFVLPRRWWDTVLLVVAFAFISVLFSDLVPRWIKNDIGFGYHLKALPCAVLWVRVVVDMWWRPNSRQTARAPFS